MFYVSIWEKNCLEMNILIESFEIVLQIVLLQLATFPRKLKCNDYICLSIDPWPWLFFHQGS